MLSFADKVRRGEACRAALIPISLNKIADCIESRLPTLAVMEAAGNGNLRDPCEQTMRHMQ